MKAIIYFKDAITKEPLSVEGLTAILGRNIDPKKRTKHYDTPAKLKTFTPFVDESYVFQSSESVVSVIGADILRIEIKD